ncbi:MAG TPA: LbtU family siderophore porin [Gammaproteobacteria bacterium]|nr:LbtU family siderophore porin [Gammaproteobacteria bacterium]
MNLKLVALSMSVLGLISSPVLADTVHKHKHHKRHHQVAHHDYKAMGAMPAAEVAPAPMATTSYQSAILDQMGQNVGNPKPMPEWFNRIGVSGGVNLDTGKWGSRTVADRAYVGTFDPATASLFRAGYTGENTKRYSLNNVYLNVGADVNEWSKAFASLSYTDASYNYSQAYQTTSDSTSLYNNNSQVNVEQAYLRISNFDCSPVFFEAGKSFQDYGRYTIHPITRSMTQVMSETLRTSLKLGFITDMGVHGSAYTFQNPVSEVNTSEKSLNWGAALGYAQPNDQLGFDIGAGYMYNIFGVNDIGNTFAISHTGGYHNRVGGLSAYADVNWEAFTVGARYTTALQSFSALDVAENMTHTNSGAKPWAAGLQAGYDFNAWAKNQNLWVGYQVSNQTVFMNLPRQRWSVGYGIDVVKNTSLSAQWDHDVAYSVAQGGPGSGNSNLISVRAAVKFG